MAQNFSLAHSYLSMFSQSKYMAFIIDGKGVVVESISSSGHPMATTLKAYLNHPIQQAFDMPVFNSLDDFFKPDKFAWLLPGAENLDPECFSNDRLSFPSLPVFDSRNHLESQVTYQLMFSTLPLTRLYLLKLSENRFLGIVTLNRMFDVENNPAALINEQGHLIHFGHPWVQLLGITDPATALNKPITDFLAFETPLFSLTGKLPEFSQVKLSDNPAPMPYSEKESRFVMLPGETDFRQNHFALTLRFRSYNGLNPNVVLGAIPPDKGAVPDIESLNIFFLGPRTMVVKTSPHELAWFDHEPLAPETEHELTVERVFRRFRIFIDKILVGEFFYDWEPMNTMATSTALFIRPGERHEILRAEMRCAHMKEYPFSPLNQSVIASPSQINQSLYYRIRTRPLRMEDTNSILCQLEDVTHLRENIEQLKQDKEKLTGLLHGDQTLPGSSPAMQAVRNQVSKIAKADITVLIEGETGTGKEMLSQTLHKSSLRRKGPLIKIDCAALPENLMESELFGHEKGAFTGAVGARPGRFEQAQNGTVFLDEVANLTFPVQAKLLNVIQDRKLQRVGGNQSINLDIRIISASNIPLSELVRQGRFREDLYYRLNQFRITLPPLRERPEDIPLFATKFANEAALLSGKKPLSVAPSAIKKLVAWQWPGNLRELRNVMVRAVLMADSREIEAVDIALETSQMRSDGMADVSTYRRPKSNELVNLLRMYRGNLKQSALHLKVHRTTLHRWVVEDNIDVNLIRKGG